MEKGRGNRQQAGPSSTPFAFRRGRCGKASCALQRSTHRGFPERPPSCSAPRLRGEPDSMCFLEKPRCSRCLCRWEWEGESPSRPCTPPSDSSRPKGPMRLELEKRVCTLKAPMPRRAVRISVSAEQGQVSEGSARKARGVACGH